MWKVMGGGGEGGMYKTCRILCVCMQWIIILQPSNILEQSINNIKSETGNNEYREVTEIYIIQFF